MVLAKTTSILIGETAGWIARVATGNLSATTPVRAGSTAGTPVYWNSTGVVYNWAQWSGVTGHGSSKYVTEAYTTGGQHTTWSELQACLDSWKAYNTMEANDITITITTTVYITTKADLTYGYGDVYTSIDNIAVASGNFTPTRTERTEITIMSTSTDRQFTLNTSLAHPTCDQTRACSLLYDSYINSLGLPARASIPMITPPPSNSPGCNPCYYQTEYTQWIGNDSETGCTISGKNVELFYFPPGEGLPAEAKMVYSYAPNITFTSPSVYLKFDELDATSYSVGGDDFVFSCDANHWWMAGGGNARMAKTMGTKIAGAILTLAPEDVSTFVLDYKSADAVSVAMVIAQGGPLYANVREEMDFKIFDSDFAARPLDLRKLTHPDPTDYYLRPPDPTGYPLGDEIAPGCSTDFPQPQCSTIFEGWYRPILSLPNHVSLLQSAWSTCLPAIYGIYDPPVALSKASLVFPISEVARTGTEYPPTPPAYSTQYPVYGSPVPRPGHPQALPSATSITYPSQPSWYSPYSVPDPLEMTPAASTSRSGPRTLQPVPLPNIPMQPPTVTWPPSVSAITTLDGVPMAPNQPYFVVVPFSTLARMPGPVSGSPRSTASQWTFSTPRGGDGSSTYAPGMPTAMEIVVGARLTLTADGIRHTLSAVENGNILVDGRDLVHGNAVLELIEPGDLSIAAGGATQDVHNAAVAMLEPGSADGMGENGEKSLVDGGLIAEETTVAILGAFFDDDGNTGGAIRPYRSGPSVSISPAAKVSDEASNTGPKPISVARPTSATTTSEGSSHHSAFLRYPWYALVIVLDCLL